MSTPILYWDDRLFARGVRLVQAQPQPGQTHWRITSGEWFDKEQSGGRHAVFLEVLDEQGRRAVGVPVRFFWSTGQQVKHTETKPDDAYAIDFPMFNAGNLYGVEIAGELPSGVMSDRIEGLGLGTIEEPWRPVHTSYQFTFQRTTVLDKQPDSTPPPPVISPGPTEPPEPQPTGNLFERSLEFVLLQEGGWADNPADPGGATMKGITLGTYTRWRESHGQPLPSKADLCNISDAEVRQIYHDWYWLPSGANSLPWPNCLAVFDLAVNGGVGRAQQFKNEVGTDFLAFNARRLEWYTRINGWPTFGAAWTRRVAALLKASVQ